MTQALVIFLSWFQNISLLFKQNVRFPPSLEFFRGLFLSLLELDFTSVPVLGRVDGINTFLYYITVEFRTRYIILAIILPIFISMTTFTLFKPFINVIWYTCMMISMATIMGGAILYIIEDQNPIAISGIIKIGELSPQLVAIIVGVILLVLLLVAAGIYKILSRLNKRIARQRWLKVKKHEQKLEMQLLETVKRQQEIQNRFRVITMDSFNVELDNKEQQNEKDLLVLTSSKKKEKEDEGIISTKDRVSQRARTHGRAPTPKSPKKFQRRHPVLQQTPSHSYSSSPHSPFPSIASSQQNLWFSPRSPSSPPRQRAADVELTTVPSMPTPASTTTTPKKENEVKKDKSMSLKRVVSLFGKTIRNKFQGRVDLQKVENMRERSREYNPFKIIYQLTLGSYITIAVAVSVALLVITQSPYFLFLGILGIVGVGLFINGILIIFERGREWNYLFNRRIKQYAMRAIFLLMSGLYTPILTSLLTGFLCREVVCPVGTYLPQKRNTFSLNTILNGMKHVNDYGCEPCTFMSNTNALNVTNYVGGNATCALVSDLCPARSYHVSNVDMTVQCTWLKSFVWGPSIIILLIFVIGLPLLFVILTFKSIGTMRLMEVSFLRSDTLPFSPELTIQKKIKGKIRAWGLALKERCFPSDQREKVNVSMIEHDEDLPQDESIEMGDHTMVASPENDVFPRPSTKMTRQLFRASTVTRGAGVTVGWGEGTNKPSVMAESRDHHLQYHSADQSLRGRLRRFASRLASWYKDRKMKKNNAAAMEKKQIQRIKDEEWQIAVGLSKNPVKSLYQDYRHRYRYMRSIIMLYKLIVVSISILLIQFPHISVPLCLCVHGLALTLLLCSQPYTFSTEDSFSVTAMVLSTINTLYTFVSSHLAEPLPDWTVYPLITLNMIMPLCLLFLIANSCCLVSCNLGRYYNRRLSKFRRLSKAQEIDYPYNMVHDAVQKNGKVDEQLTSSTLKWSISFFMVVGFVCFVCSSFVLVGMFQSEFSIPFTPSVRDYQHFDTCNDVVNQEFAGYANWSSFSSNCCCNASSWYDQRLYNVLSGVTYQIVEEWHCRNGAVKERIRQVQFWNDTGPVVEHGFDYRDFCSTSFKHGYTIRHEKCAAQRFLFVANTSTTSSPSKPARFYW